MLNCSAVPQVQALRAVEPHLGLEKLYVMGTNCVDNGPRQGLETFLQAASSSPSTVLHYEFMQVSVTHAWVLPQAAGLCSHMLVLIAATL